MVKEFKYPSPHSFIILEVKGNNGYEEAWNLESGSPSALARDGWNSKSLKAGDELRLTLNRCAAAHPAVPGT